MTPCPELRRCPVCGKAPRYAQTRFKSRKVWCGRESGDHFVIVYGCTKRETYTRWNQAFAPWRALCESQIERIERAARC